MEKISSLRAQVDQSWLVGKDVALEETIAKAFSKDLGPRNCGDLPEEPGMTPSLTTHVASTGFQRDLGGPIGLLYLGLPFVTDI